MTQIDVLPAALSAAARGVRDAAPDATVHHADLGQAALTAALEDWRVVWSCVPLLDAADRVAHALAAAAQEYADVESLLVPRALR